LIFRACGLSRVLYRLPVTGRIQHMNLLFRSEEIILLAIWRLQKTAYGLSIREEVRKATGKEWTVGALYAPLHRLERKGYINSRQGEPEKRRGGRRKVYYELSRTGKQALIHVKEIHDAQWFGIPSLAARF